MRVALDAKHVADGEVCLDELADLGQLLFEHEFGPSTGSAARESAKGRKDRFVAVHAGLFGGPRRSRARRATGSAVRTAPVPRRTTPFSTGDGQHTASGDQRNPPALRVSAWSRRWRTR
jgi:hypothetical protein